MTYFDNFLNRLVIKETNAIILFRDSEEEFFSWKKQVLNTYGDKKAIKKEQKDGNYNLLITKQGKRIYFVPLCAYDLPIQAKDFGPYDFATAIDPNVLHKGYNTGGDRVLESYASSIGKCVEDITVWLIPIERKVVDQQFADSYLTKEEQERHLKKIEELNNIDWNAEIELDQEEKSEANKKRKIQY